MDDFTETPRFVLLHARNPIGPTNAQTFLDSKITTIYGFSSKPKYDAFLRHSPILVTPCPLVRGFLQRHVDLDHTELRLVALDATSPSQPILQAATFQLIVEAFDLKQATVEVSHELILDATSGSYRIQSLAISASPKAIP